MKFEKVELAGADYNRYVFAIGDHESVILLSLLEKAYIHMPRTPETRADLQRINSMKRVLVKTVKEIDLKNYGKNKRTELKEVSHE